MATKKSSKKKPVGRIGKFTDPLFKKICDEISESEKGLVSICKSNGIAAVTFYDWIDNDESLANRYARARERQAEYMAQQIIEIAEHTEEDHTAFTGANVVNRDKLRIDARKWIAAKLLPKKYGDKVDITTDGEKLPATIIQWGNKQIKV